ncbi:MAG: hypothetical protein SynsKO_00710 [Synoicihabitans sp.]
MKRIPSIIVFVIGLVLIFLGLEASDSFGSAVSEVVNDAPSNKAIALLVIGVLATIGSGLNLTRSR